MSSLTSPDFFEEIEEIPCIPLDEIKKEPNDSWTDSVENVQKETNLLKIVDDDKKAFSSIEGELDFEDEIVNGDIDKRKGDDSLELITNYSNDESTTVDTSKVNVDIEENLEQNKGKDTAEDDGEITDDGDLEEGEVRDGSPSPKQPSKQVCRFYSKGLCTWGNVCRFLHLSGNEKGNYNMFAASPPKFSTDAGYGGSGNNMMPDEFLSSPPVPLVEPSPLASAWEKGIKTAKELVKKANKRKEEEPDFEDKRLNLSLKVNEKIVNDYPDNDDKSHRRKKRQSDSYKYEDEQDIPYDEDLETKENWRGGNYENFEIRWTRQDRHTDRRDRPRTNRTSNERDRFSRNNRNKDKWRSENPPDTFNRRADAWVDPWRRSKSPKGNRFSRSRSGSYSSLSSYSYSERGSSRSSGSYSRSSSRSSTGSRSPTRAIKKSPVRPAPVHPPKKTESTRFNTKAKKPSTRMSSSRSRSMSRTPSVSRSRSYSRSISMDSVSSASSSASGSSTGSESKKQKKINHKKDGKTIKHQTPLGSLYPDTQTPKIPKFIKTEPIDEADVDALLLEQERTKEALKATPFPSLQHLLPNSDKAKDSTKGLNKQPIKLTLLNKGPPSKAASLLKKDSNNSKAKVPEDTTKPSTGVKRPLSPTANASTKLTPAPKKSASSRRDELLKQLKAVEDAIARKRSKV